MAAQLFLFGIAYPVAAGIDSERQALYFNLCALTFLALGAWQLVTLGSGRRDTQSATEREASDATKAAAESAALPQASQAG